jgi:2C-methyl-D-erythritol 2,4-cyclodiphosphate synthase
VSASLATGNTNKSLDTDAEDAKMGSRQTAATTAQETQDWKALFIHVLVVIAKNKIERRRVEALTSIASHLTVAVPYIDIQYQRIEVWTTMYIYLWNSMSFSSHFNPIFKPY